MKKNAKKMAHCNPFAVATPNIVALINDGHRPNARKQVGSTQKLNNAFLKNTTRLLFLFILGFGSELRAQQTPKWEIGTDLLWLVGKNSLPEYSLLGRYKLSEENVLRARIGVASSDTKHVVPRLQDKRNLLFRLGYERNRLLSDDLGIYFGSDILYQYNQGYILNPSEDYKPYYSALYVLGQFPFPIKLVTNELGYVAFVGIKYHLTDNLSVSMESSLNHTVQKT